MVALAGRISQNFTRMCGHTPKSVDSTGSLKEVTPQTIFGYSAPCQKKVAHIRNDLAKSIHERDTAMVALRYVQAREGCRVTKKQSIFFSVMALVSSVIFPIAVASACHAVVSARNNARYKETAAIARSHLVNDKRLDQRTIQAIDDLDYDAIDLHKLVRILGRQKVGTTKLSSYMKTFRYEPPC